MLVSRQCDSGPYTWSPSKLGALHQNPASPRMSNLEPLTTQPDWREQYSQYLPATENTILSPSFDRAISSHPPDISTSERLFGPRPVLGHRHSLAQLGNRQDVPPPPEIERPDSAPGSCGQQVSNGAEQGHVAPPEPSQSLPTTSLDPASPSGATKIETPVNQERDAQQEAAKDRDEEEEDDDDEMLDVEDPLGRPQTDAERRAERRKMKRFR
jgi:hypothetical protein